MHIIAVKQTLNGVYEITPDSGSAFFLRSDYLTLVNSDSLKEDSVLTEEESQDLLDAALSYSAEVMAMGYLARAEQSRVGLEAKLLKKGLNKNSVINALCYLESVGYLDDGRFAGAWLRNRAIDHAEGRQKLLAELYSRGIKKDSAVSALNDFFCENDEYELCKKAYKKYIKLHRHVDNIKVMQSLLRNGFSMKHIKKAMAEVSNN